MNFNKPLTKDVHIDLPPSESFYPPFIDGRDQEFAGRGPFITVLVTLQKIGNYQLGYQIFMGAIETGEDFTLFQGHSAVHPLYNIEEEHPGYFIAVILSDAASGVRVLVTDPHPNTIPPNYGALVKEFIIKIDQKGGDQPWVKVIFNKVKVRIIESPHTFLRRVKTGLSKEIQTSPPIGF